jgi:hypothetical protein
MKKKAIFLNHISFFIQFRNVLSTRLVRHDFIGWILVFSMFPHFKSILRINAIQRRSNLIKISTTQIASFSSEQKPRGVIDRVFGLDSCVAPQDFKNRWMMVVPAFLTHMSIGFLF